METLELWGLLANDGQSGLTGSWKAPLNWLQYVSKLMKFLGVCYEAQVEMIQMSDTHTVITDMMSEGIDCMNLLPSL